MQVKLIDHNGFRSHGLTAGVILLTLSVILIVISASVYEWSGFFGTLVPLLYAASFFFVVYRPYRTVGKLILGDRDITVELFGQVDRVPP